MFIVDGVNVDATRRKEKEVRRELERKTFFKMGLNVDNITFNMYMSTKSSPRMESSHLSEPSSQEGFLPLVACGAS